MLLCASAIGVVALGGCGGDDGFENKPRPAVPLQLTGVITEEGVTVSPDRVGAGPIILLISNQTAALAHDHARGRGRARHRRPGEPARHRELQQTLQQGTYEVRAGSEQAVPKEIRAAKLEIGQPRKSSSGEVCCPSG